jgi:holo-[acyl-carrier protein] synthase
MVKGIGTDIIEIDRIEKALLKRDNFIKRMFSEKERLMFQSRNNKVETIAGNFAAKEAVSKALGTGVVFNWKDIEVLRNDLGKPIVILHGKAQEIFDDKKCSNLQLSIAHNKSHAIANCLIE